MTDLLPFVEGIASEAVVEAGLRMAAILVVALVLYWAVGLLSERVVQMARNRGGDLNFREREKRAETLAGIARTASTVVIFTVAGLMVLKELGYNIVPLLAGAGIVGVALGFGAQNLVRDVITGFFILLENQYGLGDWVQINGVDGVVKRLGLRTTVLQDMEGVTHIMPNGTIALVSNMTKEFNQSLLDVKVDYKEGLDRVRDVLEDIGSKLNSDPEFGSRVLEKPQVLGVEDLGDSGVIIRMVCKTAADQKWAVTRELRRRVKARFDSEGIEIPSIRQGVIVSQNGSS